MDILAVGEKNVKEISPLRGGVIWLAAASVFECVKEDLDYFFLYIGRPEIIYSPVLSEVEAYSLKK